MPIRRRRLSTLILSVLLLATLQPAHHAQSQAKACNDPIPKDCAKARSLGEDSKGCACFVCNPDGPNRSGVCTNLDVDKKTLYKLCETK